MIFAAKKLFFIVSIQLSFFVMINPVDSFPPPDSNTPTTVEDSDDLYTKTNDLVKNIWDILSSSTLSAFTSGKEQFLGEVDCFTISNVLQKSIDALYTDNSSTDSNVQFYFASVSKPDFKILPFQNDKFSLDGVEFNPYHNTVLITHGFLSSSKVEWIKEMKDALLKYDDYNVIAVDWEKLSITHNYIGASASTLIVGDEIAKLFHQIYDELALKNSPYQDALGNLHFIGHHLGAHVVARAANKIKANRRHQSKLKAWNVNRITGLDPAQSCFNHTDKDKRLDEDDADFVDVIQTSDPNIFFTSRTVPDRIGYFDFYPTGAEIQPECAEESIWSYILSPSKLVKAITCSHGQAYEVFTESIYGAVYGSCSFRSLPWKPNDEENFDDSVKEAKTEILPEIGINSMNYYPREKGVFFTPVGSKKPYCNRFSRRRRDVDSTLIKALPVT